MIRFAEEKEGTAVWSDTSRKVLQRRELQSPRQEEMWLEEAVTMGSRHEEEEARE